MKQGWEIKKLGEVCCEKRQIIRATRKFSPSDDIVYIDISAIDTISNEIKDPSILPFQEAPSRAQQVVENGDILVSLVRPNLKNIAQINDNRNNLVASSGFCVLRTKLNPRYIKYIVLGDRFTNYLVSRTSGANYPAVREEDVKEYSIPVPPIEEQERIVAELDCLSGIIERKREQLRELDALVQSIFYQMFGDPITNEKGWEVVLLKHAAVLKAGKAIKANELSETSNEGLYPCYGGNGIRGYINKKSHSGLFPIIGRQGALCGNVVFAQGEFYATEHAVVCNEIISSINPLWMYYGLKYNNLNRFAQGVAQPGISVSIINEMPLIHPPITLQQEFADKIEAIEKQKELIKQSITETEELFNSRMDYYFN